MLRLLEMTPATASQIRKASITFGDEPFRDDRRVRERLQALTDAGFVHSWPSAVSGGGLMHVYKLTTPGFRMLHQDETLVPQKTLTAEIAPSRFQHAMATAEIVVHTLVAAHESRVRIVQYHGDGGLTLAAGSYRQQPDFHVQLEQSGAFRNVLIEIDQATEPIDSLRENSIRTKLLGYEAYQDLVWQGWKQGGGHGPRPYFRVVFLTRGVERAHHILWFARECARNRDRHLCYAATQDAYLSEPRALTVPLFNDHDGAWQSLVNPQPSAKFLQAPIRLSPPLVPARVV